MNLNHPLTSSLNIICELLDSSIITNPFKNFLLFKCFNEMIHLLPLLEKDYISCCYNTEFEVFFVPFVDLDSGSLLASSTNADSEFNSIFQSEISKRRCLFTDGSKIFNAPFTGFSVIDINFNAPSSLHIRRSQNFLSSFCLEALAILDATTIIENNNVDTHFFIFSDFKSVLFAFISKFIPGKSNNIILLIKKASMRISNSGKSLKFIWIPGHRGIKGK